MKKVTIGKILIIALVFTTLLTTSTSFGYWSNNINYANTNKNINVLIGNWDQFSDEDDIRYPENAIIIDTTNGVPNITIPKGQYFIYNNELFMAISGNGYNPAWHGLPYANNDLVWAIASISLVYNKSFNYHRGSVVKYNGKWYIANINYHSDWIGGQNPETVQGWGEGRPWKEIEPMNELDFPFIGNSTYRNYSNPNPGTVVYK